jgi:hypothetical protein
VGSVQRARPIQTDFIDNTQATARRPLPAEYCSQRLILGLRGEVPVPPTLLLGLVTALFVDQLLENHTVACTGPPPDWTRPVSSQVLHPARRGMQPGVGCRLRLVFPTHPTCNKADIKTLRGQLMVRQMLPGTFESSGPVSSLKTRMLRAVSCRGLSGGG